MGQSRSLGYRHLALGVALAAGGVLTGVGLAGSLGSGASPPAADSFAVATATTQRVVSTPIFQPPSADASSSTEQAAETAGRADPTVLHIPAIGVESELVALGLDVDKTIEVPEDFSVAGWYRHRARPGEVGPMVILGHVDSFEGPAVFFELNRLQAGDLVELTRSDGRIAVYEITSVEQFPKDDFPTDRVYDWSNAATLRLVTCGGNFDRDRRSYDDNVIAFGIFLGFADLEG
ncbi:MAG: class F sortase [Actinobacteria bacterium]|nr:class F sortase [Actinomycetota bacterium]